MTIHNIPQESSGLGDDPFVFCLNGRVPIRDDVLGPAFTACVFCTPVCPDCLNASAFPARGSLRGLEEWLMGQGLRGVYCACGGFLGVFAGEPR